MKNGKAAAAAAAIVLSAAVASAAEAAGPRHLIYLHGRIVQEQQTARPSSERFGHYELDQILDAFRARGFVVSGEIRPRSASVAESADRVVAQVRRLVAEGVPPERITVVGASMGAAIALLVAARLGNPEIRFSILGACLSGSVAALRKEEGKGPSGRLLSLREESDESTSPCAAWTNALGPRPDFYAREVVLHTGLSHGFLYRPLPEWVSPVADWATKGGDPR